MTLYRQCQFMCFFIINPSDSLSESQFLGTLGNILFSQWCYSIQKEQEEFESRNYSQN